MNWLALIGYSIIDIILIIAIFYTIKSIIRKYKIVKKIVRGGKNGKA